MQRHVFIYKFRVNVLLLLLLHEEHYQSGVALSCTWDIVCKRHMCFLFDNKLVHIHDKANNDNTAIET